MEKEQDCGGRWKDDPRCEDPSWEWISRSAARLLAEGNKGCLPLHYRRRRRVWIYTGHLTRWIGGNGKRFMPRSQLLNCQHGLHMPFMPVAVCWNLSSGQGIKALPFGFPESSIDPGDGAG